MARRPHQLWRACLRWPVSIQLRHRRPPQLGGRNARLGQGDYIVVEADESDASFLNLLPVIAVVTNIDNDHMETYGHDFRAPEAGVYRVSLAPAFYGTAVLCTDDAHVREILPLISKPVLTYGFSPDANGVPSIARAEGTVMHFTVAGEAATPLGVRLNLPGRTTCSTRSPLLPRSDRCWALGRCDARSACRLHRRRASLRAVGEVALASGGSFT